MKKNIRHIIIIFGLVFLNSCGDDPTDVDPSIQEEVFEALSGDWGLNNGAGSIILDGTDVSANFPNFSLSFNDGIYSTTVGGDLFDASGTWEWLDEQAKQLELNDGKVITIILLNEQRFTFSFTEGGARAAGLPGSYEVSVVR